jgi:aspartyl-tRNA(Asn)/glutamyl-tRNA(Gln) amidotransferase subunit A
MLSIISGPDPRDRYSLPAGDVDWLGAAHKAMPPGLRVAYCEAWAGVPVDREIAEKVRAAAERFCQTIGAVLEEDPPPDFPLEDYRSVVAADTDIIGLALELEKKRVRVSKGLQAILDTDVTADTVRRAHFGRMRSVNAMSALMQDFDLLLTPTTACLPFATDCDGPGLINGIPVADDGWTPALFPMNLTGQPALSVPAGTSASGLPVGMQIVGRHLGDELVITAGSHATV